MTRPGEHADVVFHHKLGDIWPSWAIWGVGWGVEVASSMEDVPLQAQTA